MSCIDQEVIFRNGEACLTCPKLRPECPSPDVPMCRTCPTLPRVPARCIRLGIQMTLNGKVCVDCPEADPNCPKLYLSYCSHCKTNYLSTASTCLDKIIEHEKGNPEQPCICEIVKPECRLPEERLPRCPGIACVTIPRWFPERCIWEGRLILQKGQACRDCLEPSLACDGVRICSDPRLGCGVPQDTPRDCIGVSFPGNAGCMCPRLKEGCEPQVSEITTCPDETCVPVQGLPAGCVTDGSLRAGPDNSICYGCPSIDPFCPPLKDMKLPVCDNHLIDCLGVPSDLLDTCINQNVLFYNGRHCLSCPSIKDRCLPRLDADGVRPCASVMDHKCPMYPRNVNRDCFSPGRIVTFGNGFQCRDCPIVSDPFCPGGPRFPICEDVLPCRRLRIDPICMTATIRNDETPCITCPQIKAECLPPPTGTPPDASLPSVVGRSVVSTSSTGASESVSTSVDQTPPLLPVDPLPIDISPPQPPVGGSVAESAAFNLPLGSELPLCKNADCQPKCKPDGTCIPDKCFKPPEMVVYQEDGTTCSPCPIIDTTPECLGFALEPCSPTCPEMPPNVDPFCVDEPRLTYQGATHCLSCRVLKPECHHLLQ